MAGLSFAWLAKLLILMTQITLLTSRYPMAWQVRIKRVAATLLGDLGD